MGLILQHGPCMGLNQFNFSNLPTSFLCLNFITIVEIRHVTFHGICCYYFIFSLSTATRTVLSKYVEKIALMMLGKSPNCLVSCHFKLWPSASTGSSILWGPGLPSLPFLTLPLFRIQYFPHFFCQLTPRSRFCP